MVVPNPAIPPGQVVVHALLLPPGAPNQWGAATSIGNGGQLPANVPQPTSPQAENADRLLRVRLVQTCLLDK